MIRCKEESVLLKSSDKSPINYREGEGDPTVEDLLELIGTSCVPGSINSGTNCNDIEYTDTVVVNLPSYTTCTFTVVYKYYLCYAGSMMVDYTMGDFQILTHNCSTFSSALTTAIGIGGSTLTNFMENFESSIYDQLQAQIIAQYVSNNNNFKCGHGLFFNILFLKASCYKRCYFHLANGAATYAKIACGADCCEWHTAICIDENNVLHLETLFAPPDTEYCTDPPVFEGNPILNRCETESNCVYRCIE